MACLVACRGPGLPLEESHAFLDLDTFLNPPAHCAGFFSPSLGRARPKRGHFLDLSGSWRSEAPLHWGYPPRLRRIDTAG